MNIVSIVVLEEIELIPVLELAPFDFGAGDRSSPSGTYADTPEEWQHYWSASLADAGITGLKPIQNGSWHVPTSEFTGTMPLRRVLDVVFQKRLDLESAPDWGPLSGGLALRSRSQSVLIEPGCCADLGDAAGWRDVVGYREAGWRTLWIGHPWLSVHYHAPRLVISDPHEATDPVARWAVCPDRLQAALVPAQAELERFARQVADALPSSNQSDSSRMARKLAGLGQ
jgi:hypothetical protein